VGEKPPLRAVSVMKATMHTVSAIGWIAAVRVHGASVRCGSMTVSASASVSVWQCG
jgi:hypothetical protein